jgi:lipoate-protein ligase A
MTLEVLPTRQGGAAENMATDFLLLRRYPAARAAQARFRHYGWHRPAFTFGYAQKIADVRAQLPAGETVELCRRPTGGGIVDHRNDWTYTLVIPRAHPLCEQPAPHSYRAIHVALAAALRALDHAVGIKESCEPAAAEEGVACGGAAAPTVCFTRAELYDVIHAGTGAKVAGAAQKRTKEGLLFQGSLAHAALRSGWDEEAFQSAFVGKLAAMLASNAEAAPWPEFAEHELAGLIEQYASSEWIEQR